VRIFGQKSAKKPEFLAQGRQKRPLYLIFLPGCAIIVAMMMQGAPVKGRQARPQRPFTKEANGEDV
jgi:hypothetical protein